MASVRALARAARDSVIGRYSRWLEARFDHRYGVDTGGLHDDLAALGAGGEHLPHAYGYQPFQPQDVSRDSARGANRSSRIRLRGFRLREGARPFAGSPMRLPAERNVADFGRRRTHAACIELHCGNAVECVVSNKSFSLYRQAGQEAVVPLEEARPVDTVPAA
jgi:hypothetical protein